MNIRPYVIINGVNSQTIAGLLITELPPISKAPQRYLQEQIDGRDGDIMTPLGFGAVDKTLKIALTTGYDVDKVIEYFNAEGVIVFSNEPTKYYRFSVYEQIDFERLIRFKTAEVVLHCQPFKFSTTEEPLTFAGGEDQTIENEGNYFSKPTIAVSGSGLSTMRLNGKEPITIDFGDSQQNLVIDTEDMNAYYIKNNIKDVRCKINAKQDLNGYDSVWIGGAGKNKLPNTYTTQTINDVTFTVNNDGSVKVNGTASNTALFTLAILSDILTDGQSYNINGNASDNKAFLQLQTSQYGGVANVGNDYNLVYSTSGEAQILVIRVNAGQTANNIVLYPMIRLASVTDATFNPYENICDIEGFNAVSVDHRGKNLINNDGYFPLTKSENFYYQSFAVLERTLPKIKLQAGVTYTLSFDITTDITPFNISVGCGNGLYAVDIAQKNNLNNGRVSITFTPTSSQLASGNLLSFRAPRYTTSQTFNLTVSNVQLEINEEATEYSTYIGSKYQEYFDGLTSGKFGVYVFDGSEAWEYITSWANAGFRLWSSNFTNKITNAKAGGMMFITDAPYKNVGSRFTTWDSITAVGDKVIGALATATGLVCRDDSITTASDFKQSLIGKTLIYELASPIELPTISQEQLNDLLADFGAKYPSVMLTQNLFGGLELANAFSSGVSDYSIDTTNKTFTFSHTSTTGVDKILLDSGFKENTQYTFVANYTAVARNTSLRFYYTDGTNSLIDLVATSNKTHIEATSTAGKTVSAIGLGYWGAGLVTMYYDESGLYEGNIGAKVFGAQLDVNTGLLTVTHAKYRVTSQTTINRNNANAWYFGATPSPKATGEVYYNGVYSDKFASGDATAQNVIYIHPQGIVRINTLKGYANASELLADIGDFDVVYPVANPITIQLEPKIIEQFLGVNTLSHNANGNTVVDYKHDGEEITTEGDIVTFTIDAGDLEIGELANRLVSGNYDNIRLSKGDNTIGFSGNVNGFSVEKYSRWQ